MALNGYYRCKDIIIRKYDELGDPVVGFPHNYSMVDATTYIYDGDVVTDLMISTMISGAIGDVGTWNDMVDDFRSWAEGQEALLVIQSDQINVPYGQDLITCPIAYGDYNHDYF